MTFADSHSHLSARSHEPEPEDNTPQPTLVPKGKVTSYDNFDGTTKVHGPTSSNQGQPTVDPSDILSTGQSVNGQAVASSSLTSNDLVMWHGMQVRVGGLVEQGILTANPNGGFSVAPKAPQEARRQETEPRGEAFSPEVEQVASDLASRAGADVQLMAISEFSQKGELSRSTIEQIASSMGVQPDAAKAMTMTVIEAFQDQASNALASFGEPSEVASWAKANMPKEFAQAARQLATNRTSAGFNGLGKAYMIALDQTDTGRATILGSSDAAARGIKEVNKGGKKCIVLKHPTAGEISWAAACKMGLIGPNIPRF